jgi:formylglycine-generating enzyme required for sulfatase activity
MKTLILLGALTAIAATVIKEDGLKTRQTEMGDMQFVKGGTFQMGDVFDEGVQFAAPVHEVSLSSFYLNKYETTVEEFGAFINDTKYVTSAEKESKCTQAAGDKYSQYLASCGAWMLDPKKGSCWAEGANWKNPQFEQSPKDPVTCVSWRDAVRYCNWLSKKEGLPVAYEIETGSLLDANGRPTTDITKVKGYRLPTEAEWEYAARERGKKIRFGHGQDVARSSEMNFNAAEGEFDYAEKGEFRKKTIPVGSFKPNTLGLYDMSGNVWEWCSDFVGQYTKEPETDPYQEKGMMGLRRAARGGPWVGDASFARVSTRLGWVADDRCNNIGFRIARSE